MSDLNEPRRIGRRTIAKGTAWTVPVIVGGVSAVPAYAQSGNVPAPGDHCYQGGQSVNAFRFYTLQPTLVGDTITLSGPALLQGTTVVGHGIHVSLVSCAGAPPSRECTYVVDAVDGNVGTPYLMIAGTNSTGNPANRSLTVVQAQAGQTETWEKEFVSNTTNCQVYGWPSIPVTPAP